MFRQAFADRANVAQAETPDSDRDFFRIDRSYWIGWAVFALIALYFALSLQTKTSWLDFQDGGEYMRLADNLLEGRPYSDLGLVTDPHYRTPAFNLRSVYPAGYPAIIAALWTLGGESRVLLKICNIAFFFLALIPATLLLSRLTQSRAAGLSLILLWLISPIFIETKEIIFSDLPFTAMVFWFLLFWERYVDGHARGTRSYLVLAALGIFMFCAIATRTVGVALMPAIVIHEIWKRRRIPYSALTICAIAAGLAVMLAVALPRAGPGYLASYASDRVASNLLGLLLLNAQQYRWAFEMSLDPLMGTTIGAGISVVLTGLVVSLALIGAWSVIRRDRVDSLLLFTFFYFGIVFVFPTLSAWGRYLLPILPVVYGLALVGLQAIFGKWPRRATAAIRTAIVVVGLCSVAAYARSPLSGTVDTGFPSRTSDDLLAFLRDHTKPDDVIAFDFPHMITRYAHRPAALLLGPRLAAGMTPMQQLCHYRQMQVDYVIFKTSVRKEITPYYYWDFSDRQVLQWLVGGFPASFQEVSRNEDFRIFRLLDKTPCA